MPRKTKKQKIQAALHKQNLYVAKLPVEKEVTPEESPEKISQAPSKSPENSYFFKDLKKSLILSAIVVTLEIALYYARLIK